MVNLKISSSNEPVQMILCEQDYKRVILEFSKFKGTILMKIAEQWKSATDDDDDFWKYNKHQINLTVEPACDLLQNLKRILNLPEFIENVEDFMVNGVEVNYHEEKEMRREGKKI